jgi:cob(I)alamin adenosyltransferase
MFNNKYGDEGLTKLFNLEISKASEEVSFLSSLKEYKAYIKILINYINPFTYYYINDVLTNVINTLIDIENDYVNNTLTYKVNSVISIEKEIELIKDKIKDYKPKDHINNKISSLCELIYAKGLKLEGEYYKLNKEYKFQSYLNRINDYFYYLIYLIDKEM